MSDLPTVPFGKYKNKPMTEMIKDESYVNWCKNQPGLLDKYPIIYNIIYTQRFGEQDNPTPEHNKMQNLFLDKNMNIKIVNKVSNVDKITNNKVMEEIFEKIYIDDKYKELFQTYRFDVPKLITYNINTEFEAKYNWDVFIECQCKIDNYDEGNYNIMIKKEHVRRYDDEWKYYNKYFSIFTPLEFGLGCDSEYSGEYEYELYFRREYSYLLFIELKPNLGDDYPCVLRKIKKQIEFTKIDPNNNRANRYGDKWKHKYILIIDQYESETTSIEQLKKIFNQSNIHIVLLNDLLNNQELLE